MSKIQSINHIRKEIKKLNKNIDLRIIKGLPYKAEARRHKFLASQFYGFYGMRKVGWFKRAMHVLASFTL
ncbi:MAG TPA: hypothetical protein VJI66_01310 [Candidatus Paceibacterota bacterium]